jgi:TonB family protein
MLVTSARKFALCIGVIISFLCAGIYAQSAGTKANHFAAEGISFDYPSEYSVKDESTPEEQQFIITREGSSVQLRIVIPLRLVTRSTYPVAVESFTRPMVTKVAMALGEGQNSPQHTSFHTQIGTKQAEGVRLQSTGSEKKTTEVIWLRWSLRLVEFVFVRSDADESVGAQLWQTVSSSLRIEAPVLNVKDTEPQPKNEGTKIQGDLLNGRALSLGWPSYPPVARAAHVSGTVTVQVIIDEQGNVIAARAVDGHPLLQPAAVSAARQSRFSRTLLDGEPVRVTGVIKYNFVAR